jgi:ribosomal protein L37E
MATINWDKVRMSRSNQHQWLVCDLCGMGYSSTLRREGEKCGDLSYVSTPEQLLNLIPCPGKVWTYANRFEQRVSRMFGGPSQRRLTKTALAQCRRCGHPLFAEASIEAEHGPLCARRVLVGK